MLSNLRINSEKNSITFNYDLDEYIMGFEQELEDYCIINISNLTIPTSYSLKFQVNSFESILPNKILKSKDLFLSNVINLIKAENMKFKVDESMELIHLTFGCQVINDYNEVNLEIPITSESKSADTRLPKIVKVLKSLKSQFSKLTEENNYLKSTISFHEEEISNIKQLILGINNSIEQNANKISISEDSIRSEIHMKIKENQQAINQTIEEKATFTEKRLNSLEEKNQKNFLKLKCRTEELMLKFNTLEKFTVEESSRKSTEKRFESTPLGFNESLNDVKYLF